MRRWTPLAALLLAGCHTDLWVQPKTPTMEANGAFPGGQSDRPPVRGTVAFTPHPLDDSFLTGQSGGHPLLKVPVAEAQRTLHVDSLHALLARGRERFDVFCSPCHGRLGDGEGMIARRGLALARRPRNLHLQRVRDAADGHIFDVITTGYGAMMSYGDRVPPEDRWAIVAYVRALELSEDAGHE